MPMQRYMLHLSPDDIYDLRRRLGGLTAKGAAALCGVHADTWQRWESGKVAMPYAAARLLMILCGGDLGAMHPDWSGFHLYPDGLLYPPDYARGYGPQDVIGLHWTRQIADAHLTQKRREPIPTPRRVTFTVEIDEAGRPVLIDDSRRAG